MKEKHLLVHATAEDAAPATAGTRAPAVNQQLFLHQWFPHCQIDQITKKTSGYQVELLLGWAPCKTCLPSHSLLVSRAFSDHLFHISCLPSSILLSRL